MKETVCTYFKLRYLTKTSSTVTAGVSEFVKLLVFEGAS